MYYLTSFPISVQNEGPFQSRYLWNRFHYCRPYMPVMLVNNRGQIRGSTYKDEGTPLALHKHFDSLSLSLSTPIARSIASFPPPSTPLYIALYFYTTSVVLAPMGV